MTLQDYCNENYDQLKQAQINLKAQCDLEGLEYCPLGNVICNNCKAQKLALWVRVKKESKALHLG